MILNGVLPGVPDPYAPIFAQDGSSVYSVLPGRLTVVAQVVIGTWAAANNPNLLIDRDRVTVNAGTYSDIAINGTHTFNTTTGGNFFALRIAPTINGDANVAAVYGMYFAPTMNGSTTTIDNAYGLYVNTTHGFGTCTNAFGALIMTSETLGTMTAATALELRVNNTSGTVTTAIGLKMTTISGSTVWGFQVGNYNSYHQGALALGGTTAATWLLHVQGGNAARSGIGIDVSTTGPTAPGSSASGVISIYKGATNWYLLVTFNDAGTTRYRYMQLNSTTATWTHATSLPA